MNKRIYRKHIKYYYRSLVWRMCTASPSKLVFKQYDKKHYFGGVSKRAHKKIFNHSYKVYKKFRNSVLNKPRTLRNLDHRHLLFWGLLAQELGLSVYPQVMKSCDKAGGMR